MKQAAYRDLKTVTKGLAKAQLPVLFLLCLILVGMTSGFLTSQDQKVNKLTCGANAAGIVEAYDPPAALNKGQSCTKQVRVKNEGSVPCYVRVFAEVADPDMRSGIDISMDNENWSTKAADGYYYYSSVLQPGEETSPLFSEITANADVTGFSMICYSETVQAYGFTSARQAFSAVQ